MADKVEKMITWIAEDRGMYYRGPTLRKGKEEVTASLYKDSCYVPWATHYLYQALGVPIKEVALHRCHGSMDGYLLGTLQRVNENNSDSRLDASEGYSISRLHYFDADGRSAWEGTILSPDNSGDDWERFISRTIVSLWGKWTTTGGSWRRCSKILLLLSIIKKNTDVEIAPEYWKYDWLEAISDEILLRILPHENLLQLQEALPTIPLLVDLSWYRRIESLIKKIVVIGKTGGKKKEETMTIPPPEKMGDAVEKRLRKEIQEDITHQVRREEDTRHSDTWKKWVQKKIVFNSSTEVGFGYGLSIGHIPFKGEYDDPYKYYNCLQWMGMPLRTVYEEYKEGGIKRLHELMGEKHVSLGDKAKDQVKKLWESDDPRTTWIDSLPKENIAEEGTELILKILRCDIAIFRHSTSVYTKRDTIEVCKRIWLANNKITDMKIRKKLQGEAGITAVEHLIEGGHLIGKVTTGKFDQVILPRLAECRLIYANPNVRVAELGKTIGRHTYDSNFNVGYNIIRVVGASALGIKEDELHGWCVSCGNSIATMVVPDEVYDLMLPIWESGFVIWPESIECRGIPNSYLPVWNGLTGERCLGTLRENLPEYGYNNIKIYATPQRSRSKSCQIQQRESILVMDATFSNEVIRGDWIMWYIPLEYMRCIHEVVIDTLAGGKWKWVAKDVPVMVGRIIKALTYKVGMLCVTFTMKGPKRGKDIEKYQVSRAAPILDGKKWKWKVLEVYGAGSIADRSTDYLLRQVVAKTEVFWKGKTTPHASHMAGPQLEIGEEGTVLSAPRMNTFDVWKLGYKGLYGVCENGKLVSFAGATDSQKKGTALRSYMKKKVPPTPSITPPRGGSTTGVGRFMAVGMDIHRAVEVAHAPRVRGRFTPDMRWIPTEG